MDEGHTALYAGLEEQDTTVRATFVVFSEDNNKSTIPKYGTSCMAPG